jgi:hypothetical protein
MGKAMATPASQMRFLSEKRHKCVFWGGDRVDRLWFWGGDRG